MTAGTAKKSDLPVRLASAIVMLAVAGFALWQGGFWLDLFIVLVALATFVELVLLVIKASPNMAFRLVAIICGAVYVGLAGLALAWVPGLVVAAIIAIVVAIDSGAYFVGRAIGGPRIAPSISPSKTWAGLVGGMIGGGALCVLTVWFISSAASAMAAGNENSGVAAIALGWAALAGAGLAVAAQAGDFLESWLKRKAGAKDSSHLIPGHGGVFDRTDGLIPVALIVGGAYFMTVQQ